MVPCGHWGLAYRTDLLRGIRLELLGGVCYTDEEYRCIPWCHVSTVRIDHIPVYTLYRSTEGHSISFDGLRAHAGDKRLIFFHAMKQGDFGCAGSRTAAQEMAFRTAVIGLAVGYINNSLLLDPSSNVRRELMAFDRDVRMAYPEVYRLMGENKRVRALRLTGYALYAAIARMVTARYRKANPHG